MQVFNRDDASGGCTKTAGLGVPGTALVAQYVNWGEATSRVGRWRASPQQTSGEILISWVVFANSQPSDVLQRRHKLLQSTT